MTRFKLNPSWRISRQGDELVLSGGQDIIYTLEVDTKSSFFETLEGGSFNRSSLPAADLAVLEQLLSAGIIQPALQVEQIRKPILRELSDKESYDLLGCADSDGKCDLTVLVRTSKSMADFFEHIDYLNLEEPHLFVDLAFYDLISIGPLVFPGATACIGCLQGRLTVRWGDAPPPQQPKAASDLKSIAAALCRLEISRFFEEDFFLTNRTSVFNPGRRDWEHNKLLRVPLCPYCEKWSKGAAFRNENAVIGN